MDNNKTGKRKRQLVRADSATAISRPSHLPPDSINPFSRSPGQLLQFSVAGLDDKDEDPGIQVADFPHRGLDYGLKRTNVDFDAQAKDGGGDQSEQEGRPTEVSSYIGLRTRQLHVLLQSIYRFLDDGDIDKASKAYGLALQIRPHGHVIDVRHYDLWAIGAEIIIREGELSCSKVASQDKEAGDTSGRKSAARLRWGSAANMNKVRAYFETLIQQHPYDYRMPHKLSAVDFWIALLSIEIYNTHAEHVIALRQIEEESQGWDDDMDEGMVDNDDNLGTPKERHERRMNELKDRAREKAMESMREIAGEMDNIAQDQPFPKSHNFLRLRAAASLYMADLVMPIIPTSSYAAQEGQRRRHAEQQGARVILRRIVELGGELDLNSRTFLGDDEEEEDDDDQAKGTYSSLPIR